LQSNSTDVSFDSTGLGNSAFGSATQTDVPETRETQHLPGADSYTVIPIDQIQDPHAPMRETMDEQLLAELADSIAAVGVQTPLRVFKTAEAYEVIAGHRRLIACRIVGLSEVPCIVDGNPQIPVLTKMIAENCGREEVNPVEEARLYGRILTEMCNGDVDQVVDLVKRTRHHVEDRLNLLAIDEKVLIAVEHKHISMAVARELNKVEDPDRRLVFLDAAVRGGSTARTVMEWRQQAAGLAPIGLAPECTTDDPSQHQKIPPTPGFTCLFCGDSEDVHLMELIYLHRQCKRLLCRIVFRDAPQPAAEG